MALAETARLLASIELQDKFTGTLKTIEGKLDTFQTKARTTVDRAKGKFGEFKTALRDTNTQIGIVGTALAGIENFVPPSLRPFIRGLEDINNIAPRGIPGLVSGGIKVVVDGLKPILDPLKSAITDLKTSFTSPEGIGVKGRLALIGESIGLVAAVYAVNESIKAGNTLLAEHVHATGTDFSTHATTPELQTGIAAVDAALAKLNADPVAVALNLAGAGAAVTELKGLRSDLTSAIKDRDMNIISDIKSAIPKPPTPIVNVSVRNQILGQTVTTTYSRYVTPSIAGLLP